MFESINNNFENLFNNTSILFLIKSLLVYYILFISFKLNNELIVIFDNSIIKILILVIIFYTSTYNFEISILLILAFMFSLNTLNKIKLDDLLNINEEKNYLDTELDSELDTELDTELDNENDK
jgi:hypothetical protein